MRHGDGREAHGLSLAGREAAVSGGREGEKRAGGGVGSMSPPGGAFRFAATMADAPYPA